MSDAKELWASGASVASAITKAKPGYKTSTKASNIPGLVSSCWQVNMFFPVC